MKGVRWVHIFEFEDVPLEMYSTLFGRWLTIGFWESI